MNQLLAVTLPEAWHDALFVAYPILVGLFVVGMLALLLERESRAIENKKRTSKHQSNATVLLMLIFMTVLFVVIFRYAFAGR